MMTSVIPMLMTPMIDAWRRIVSDVAEAREGVGGGDRADDDDEQQGDDEAEVASDGAGEESLEAGLTGICVAAAMRRCERLRQRFRWVCSLTRRFLS